MASSGSSEEFRRGPQIKLTFILNPELHAFLRQWSEDIPTLYFVDICAANVTKLSQGAVAANARKSTLVDRLKRLDEPQNSFSYLLALVEKVNDPRGNLSDEKLREQILGDIAALRAFFTKARVIESDGFLVDYAQALRGRPHELSQPAYIQFLRAANDRFALANAVARPLRLQKAEQILMEADALSVARQHPVVLVALACLYGNSDAKKVMKFKSNPARFSAENALADIMVVVRFFQRKLEIEQLGRESKSNFARSDFVTDDVGLAGILRRFEGDAVKRGKKGNVHQTQTTLTVKFDLLFPELPTFTEGYSDKPGEAARSVVSEAERLRELLTL